jgi:hypothetical protein
VPEGVAELLEISILQCTIATYLFFKEIQGLSCDAQIMGAGCGVERVTRCAVLASKRPPEPEIGDLPDDVLAEDHLRGKNDAEILPGDGSYPNGAYHFERHISFLPAEPSVYGRPTKTEIA